MKRPIESNAVHHYGGHAVPWETLVKLAFLIALVGLGDAYVWGDPEATKKARLSAAPLHVEASEDRGPGGR